MSRAHLTVEGDWLDCQRPGEACLLPYHVPDMTGAEVQQLPSLFLEQLIEAVDPPAVTKTGDKEWRVGDPAHERVGFTLIGRLHREYDLPAAIQANGIRRWMKKGLAHRIKGPALTHPDGSYTWYWEGLKHRDGDEPASRNREGVLEWWQMGELQRGGDKPAVVRPTGTLEWWWESARHRDNDLPAIIHPNGILEWYQRGELHRDGYQPALLHPDGSGIWYQDGKPHRVGAPAVIVHGGPGYDDHMEYWEYGELIKRTGSPADSENQERPRDALLMLHRKAQSYKA